MAYLNGKKIALNPKFNGVVNFKPLYDVLGLEPTISGDVVTVEELTALVEGINSLGIANLKKKLSEVYDDLTTVEIMSLIDSIETGINLDHTVTFIADGEPYEVVSVKDGNSINAPLVEPTSVSGFFAGWQLLGGKVGFPYIPTEDVVLTATFDSQYYSNKLYEHFGISPIEYPIVVVEYAPNTKNLWVIFGTSITERTDDLLVPYPSLKTGSKTVDIGDITTENAVNSCIAKINSVSVQTSGRGLYGNNNEHYWINKALTKTYENLNIHYF